MGADESGKTVVAQRAASRRTSRWFSLTSRSTSVRGRRTFGVKFRERWKVWEEESKEIMFASNILPRFLSFVVCERLGKCFSSENSFGVRKSFSKVSMRANIIVSKAFS